MDELGAQMVPVPVPAEWQITGSLLRGFDAPVYRFIPGITQSEGFFIALLRKTDDGPQRVTLPASLRAQVKKFRQIHILSDGIPTEEIKGKEKIPPIAQALSITTPQDAYPRVELTLEQAQHYLHRESLLLPPAAPRGFVLVTYKERPLGFMKNLAERANNLYPKNWAIKKL